MVSLVASLSTLAYRDLKKILPGPYTVLLKSNDNFLRKIKDKRQVVGIRVPQSPLLLALIDYYQKPLATSSLGVEEGISFGYQIEEQFGHGIDLLLDLGEEVIPRETTILDLTGDEMVVVREGVSSVDMF